MITVLCAPMFGTAFLVENTREKHLNWIRAIMRLKGWSQTELARAAGIDPSTLSRFIRDVNSGARLNTLTIEKIEALGVLPAFETERVARPPGLAEQEAAPFMHETADPVVKLAVNALKGGRNGVDPWLMHSRALEHEGYLPGDILIVDLNAAPRDGDVVCAQVYDRLGEAETVMRIWHHPFLTAASGDPSVRRPLLVDNERVVLRGVVIASFRPRRHTA